MKIFNKTTVWIAVIGIIATALILINVAKKSFDKAASSNQMIKIGVLLPLSGSLAVHGEPIKDGFELAKYVSKNQSIQLIYEDTQCDPKMAISAFNKLLNQDHVQAITGIVCSGEALAIMPLANQNKIPIIASTASSPALTGISDYFFRIYPSDANDADIISNYATNIGSKSIALLSINNDYGQAIKNIITKNLGTKISVNETFNFGTVDFRSFLLKAKSASLIILVAYPDSTPVFLKQKNELGLRQTTIGSAATFASELSTDLSGINNFIFTSPDLSTNGKQAYEKSFHDFYGKDAIFPAEYGYDTFLVLNQSIKSNSNATPESLIKSFSSTDVQGATGDVRFDKSHDREGVVFKVYRIDSSSNVKCIADCN